MLYQTDLPDDIAARFEAHTAETGWIACDTETTGLNPTRDRLCVVQIYDGGDLYAAVQLDREHPELAVNLVRVLDEAQLIFHHAPFDLGFLDFDLEVRAATGNVYCTRVGNKIARTAAPKHSLADVVWDLCGVKLDKSQQTSDWGAPELDPEQLAYAKGDVIYLHEVRAKQLAIANREGRENIMAYAQHILPGINAVLAAGFGLDIYGH